MLKGKNVSLRIHENSKNALALKEKVKIFFINTALLQFFGLLMRNLYLNEKHETAFF